MLVPIFFRKGDQHEHNTVFTLTPPLELSTLPTFSDTQAPWGNSHHDNHTHIQLMDNRCDDSPYRYSPHKRETPSAAS